MAPTVALREAEPADVSAIEVVRRQAIEAGFSGTYDRSAFAPLVAGPSAALPTWIESDATLSLVVETDVTLVAVGVFDAGAGEILALYTAPDYQGRGCATALVDRFERAAIESGASSMTVTAPTNAVPFFENRGFVRRGETERDGLRMIELRRDVPAADA